MSKKYTQKVHMDDLGTKVVAIGQTRGGQDEWITPMALWELDDATGLYMPPGASPDPRRPRTDTRLTDENGDLITGTNRLPVDVGGQIKADVDLGDVTVQIGEVQQGKRGQNAESWQVRAEELEQEIQELRQLLESGDTKVQLTGRNIDIEVVTVFDALAISDTSAHNSGLINLRRFRSVTLMALHSLDKPVNLLVRGGRGIPPSRAPLIWDDQKNEFSFDTPSLYMATIPPLTAARWVYLYQHPVLKRFLSTPLAEIQLSLIAADEAPTSGSITLEIWGVPN